MKKFRITLYPKSDLELAWLVRKHHFDIDGSGHRTCMRCGGPMRQPLAENALSRAMNVYICSDCGVDEALRDATGEILHVSEWSIVKHHYFGEHEKPNVFRLLPSCHFKQVFDGPKKTLPMSCAKHPESLVAYSRSDYDGHKWWTTWVPCPDKKATPEQAAELDGFMDTLLAMPEFQTLSHLRRMCHLYAEPTKEDTEFNLYSETNYFYVWLKLITREKDYNLYVHFYSKE